MSQIGKSKIYDHELEITLKCIDRILALASHYNGKFFGGYVRDVIVPRMKDPNCNVSFKDVDIWFTSDKDAEGFSDVMRFTEKMRSCQPSRTSENEYKFKRTQYLVPNNACHFFIDVIVSKNFPVNDFNVNFLTYSLVDGVKTLEAMGFYFKDLLIESIHKKEAYMLGLYAKELNRKDWALNAHTTRFNERYIARGWTIIYDGVKITKAITGVLRIHIMKLKLRN